MATTRRERGAPAAKGKEFLLEVGLELPATAAQAGALTASVIGPGGAMLASGPVGKDATARLKLRLAAPAAVELVVLPAVQAQREPHATGGFRHHFAAKEWRATDQGFRLQARLSVPEAIVAYWLPQWICISGHVRKTETTDGVTRTCPVPYVKVEIFDVDREGCLWPWLRDRWADLLDRPVIRLPDLTRVPPHPPRPFPEPDPAPCLTCPPGPGPDRVPAAAARSAPLEARAISPFVSPGAAQGFNPQPEPPPRALGRVGELARLSEPLARGLENLTVNSRVAPWLVFPHCFYSRALVCETSTDCSGAFTCCFPWWPLHVRRGRLRFDARPDIVVRITQVVNGVETVLYLDPYTSTRWNVTGAHLDLYLDDPAVRCGSGCGATAEGSAVFFTRIGLDEVYQINQATGLYHDLAVSQAAYGRTLNVYAAIGDALASAAPARYYKLSFAPAGSSSFKTLDTELWDTRVDKTTLASESHKLGPYPVGAEPALYEVRNADDYYWYNPDLVGIWDSLKTEADTGKYVLRLEVYDAAGTHLTTGSGLVDYRDGTVVPPAVLPPMTDHCDLVITLDNKAPVVNLTVPAAINDCGVVPWSPALVLDFNVHASQENGRLQSWTLSYAKGLNPASYTLGSGYSPSGALSPVNTSVSGAALLSGLTGTCAFALELSAWAHIRNGYGWVYRAEVDQAIAIEKCT